MSFSKQSYCNIKGSPDLLRDVKHFSSPFPVRIAVPHTENETKFCIWRERIHTIWHWTQQVSQGPSNSSAQKGKPAGEKQSINESEWHMQLDCLLCWQLVPSLLLEKSCKQASLVLSSLLLWVASFLSWLTVSVSWCKKACCPQVYWWRQSLHSQNMLLQPPCML